MNEIENPNFNPASKYDKFLQFLDECGDESPMVCAKNKNINLEHDYGMIISTIVKKPEYKDKMTLSQWENLGKIAKHYNPDCGPNEGCGGKCGTGFCTRKILSKISELENPKIN